MSDTADRPAAVRLVVRRRKGIARRPRDLADAVLTLRWDRAPATCALVAPRLPLEAVMLWGFFPRPDTDNGCEVASFHVPAWDRDPPVEWPVDRPEAGQLVYRPFGPHAAPVYSRNPQQKQVRFDLYLRGRGTPAALDPPAAVFATAESPAAAEGLAEAIRVEWDRSFAMGGDSTLRMALEPA